MFLLVFGGLTLAAQTQIDLRTQAKNVDFTAANSTRPIKTGTVLPATCVPGDMFFNTAAPAGANLFVCPAANTWSAQGNLSVKSGGITVGRENAANFITGAGLMNTVSDDGSEINIQSALDTAVVQTQPGEQSGSALQCASSSGSASQYTCSLTPTLAAYTSGMVLHWKPDVAGAGGPTTINVDTLGTKPLKAADGVSDPAPTDISAGKLYNIWYDGSVFRMMAGAGGASGGSSMTYPGAGVPNSTGSAWGTSYAVGASANDLVQLNASGQLPAVSAALLTNFPTLNQSTTGNAATATALASTPAQCSGGQYSTGVAASGNANCAQVAYSQVSGAPTIPTASGSNPAMDGTAATGSSANYARADHVHPTDTTRQAAITGAPGAWPSSFTPSPHASTHQNGGSDEIATATPGANAIPKAGSGGTLAAAWIPSALSSTTSVNGTPIPASSALMTPGTAVQASQMPALSGDCTSAAGSTVLTCTKTTGALRTYPFFWQGVMQAGISGFAVNLPASGGPAPANSGGTMPIAVLEWPAAQSAYYAWWTWVMPAGYISNAAIGYSIESRCNAATCDSTRANIMTLGLGCSGGAALDAPAIVNASPVNVINGASAAQTITAGTLAPNSGGLPACAAGNRVWVRMIVDTNTNSLTGPFDLVSVTFSVQGGM